jgi:hypothetical protein
MTDVQRVQPKRNTEQEAAIRIAESLERLERRLDEFFKIVLDAKFPYGQGTDRWATKRRGAA